MSEIGGILVVSRSAVNQNLDQDILQGKVVRKIKQNKVEFQCSVDIISERIEYSSIT